MDEEQAMDEASTIRGEGKRRRSPGPARDGFLQADIAVSDICGAHGNSPSALLEILHDVAAHNGGIAESDVADIARALNLSRAEVYGTKSFYRDFNRSGVGQLLVEICLGEACRSCGAGELYEAVKPRLDAGGVVKVDPVYCLGNCALAPAIAVDGATYGRINDPEMVYLLAAGLEP